MSFFSEDLFNHVMIKPMQMGADKLLIISGYATATMVESHAERVKDARLTNLNIELIVGMGVKDGIQAVNHRLFIDLESRTDLLFQCSYIVNRPPVHSKVYIWLKNGIPFQSFTGSANYTQNGFSSSSRESVALSSPEQCTDYFKLLLKESVRCSADSNKLDTIDFYKDRRVLLNYGDLADHINKITDPVLLNTESVTLSLLDTRTGDIHKTSGLNWGQREGRDKNQAYIAIPAEIGRTSFFPPKTVFFTLETDDEKQLICVVAQAEGKAIHSRPQNSLLGMYFRYRLGLKSGQPVTLADLKNYGRTDVTISKIDEEHYFLDFSV